LIFFICIPVRSADAHKVNIFAYAENGKIHAEGYFADGSKCKNSYIEIIDNKTGKKLLEGKTNEYGQFSFDIPRASSLKLILYAGAGHRNEYTLAEDEIREAMLQDKKTEKQALQNRQTVSEPESQKLDEPAGITHDRNMTITYQDTYAAIERIIDKKLQPVINILLKLQKKTEKPGLTEILGGIGYIIGIIGIIAYFKGRSATSHNRH
jgi:nickel transport protein